MDEQGKKLVQLLIAYIVAFVLVISLFGMFYSKNRSSLHTLEQEIEGASHISNLYAIGLKLQEIRDLSQRYYMKSEKGEHKAIEERAVRLRKEVRAGLQVLSPMAQSGSTAFNRLVNTLLQNIDDTLNIPVHEGEKVFESCSQVIKEISDFYLNVGDRYLLLFDPVRESYLIMTLVVMDFPVLIEDVTRAHGLGARLMQNPEDHKEEIYRLMHFQQNYSEHIVKIGNVLEFLTGDDKKGRFRDIARDFIKVRSLCDEMTDIIALNAFSQTLDASSASYADVGTNAVRAINGMYVDAVHMLEQLLLERQSVLGKEKIYVVALLIIIILAMMAGFIVTFLDIRKKGRVEKYSKSLRSIKSELVESPTLKEACDKSLNYLCKEFSALKGVLYLFNHQNKKLYLGATYAVNAQSLRTVLLMGETIIGQVSKDKVEHYRQLDKEDMNVQQGLLGVSSGAVMTIPVIHEGEVKAVAQLQLDGMPNKEQREYMDEMCDVFAAQIHQKSIYEQSDKIIALVDEKIITSQTNEKGIIIGVSQAFADIAGYAKDELVGKPHNVVRHPDMSPDTFKELWETIKGGRPWNGEIKNRTKDGGYYWVNTTISPNFDFYGNIIGYTALRVDITDKKRIEELSIRDSLTGLHNRRHFDEKFEEMMKFSKREQRLLAFVMMDVDHFKQYNDTYGHQLGDNALKAIAGVLKQSMNRPGDGAYRLGGEEFGILFLCKDETHAFEFADAIRKSVEALHIEHINNSASSYVTVSMGACMIRPDMTFDHDELYKRADDALYHAKKSGRNRVTCSKELH